MTLSGDVTRCVAKKFDVHLASAISLDGKTKLELAVPPPDPLRAKEFEAHLDDWAKELHQIEVEDKAVWDHKAGDALATRKACAHLYETTIDKKNSDLTVRETEIIRACKLLGYYER